MTGMMLLYLSIGMMVLSVLSNRYWTRQLAATRAAQAKIRMKAEEAAGEAAELAAAYAQIAAQHAEAEKRVAKAEQDMQAALLELERTRDAPVNRYHVFDRLEPRQGRFWEAAVRGAAGGARPSDRSAQRAWSGIRRFVLIADTERDARERVAARFSRRTGFELLEVVPCRLSGLTVSRIAELSTFRKRNAAEEESRPSRRTASGRA